MLRNIFDCLVEQESISLYYTLNVTGREIHVCCVYPQTTLYQPGSSVWDTLLTIWSIVTQTKALINFCSIHLSSGISSSLLLSHSPSCSAPLVPSLLALCHFHRLLCLERFSLLRPSLLGNPSAACNEMARMRGRERCRDTYTKIPTEREMEQDGDTVRRKPERSDVPVWSFAGLRVIHLSGRFR